MKKIFGIALVLGLALMLSLGGLALATDPPPGITTFWEFEGPGEIDITTSKLDGAGGDDHINVISTGSWSLGTQSVTATPHGYAWCGTDFRVDREVAVGDGQISTWTTRENTYPYWGAYTEYGAIVDTEGTGSLSQSFYNTYYYAGMSTHLVANSPFMMGVYEYGDVGGEFEFEMGAEGSGSGELSINLTDKSEHNGTRLLYGDYFLYADPANAGLNAYGETLLALQGYTETPSLWQGYDFDWAGNFSTGGSGDFVELGGTIIGAK